MHLLVPVTGNEVSRRAADVAIAIARASECPITALYVATGGASNGRKRRGFRARRHEQAIMKDVVEMADPRDVMAQTAVHSDVAPHEAILAEVKIGHDLIVMGVSRRPGDNLFFGDTAAAALENAAASIVFVAS